MRFLSLLVGAVLVALSVAQQSTIAFTSVPASVTAGQSYNLTWGGGDGEAVTITLRKGDPTNLQTIEVLTAGATGTSYIWTPSTSLVDGDNYALQITQGLDSINYSGQFTVTGGVNAASASASSILASASSASASSASASAASANSSITSTTSSVSKAATASASSSNSTGTGISSSRNNTISSATLGTSGTVKSTSVSTTSVTGSSTATGSSPATASSTSSSTSGDTPTYRYASPIALFCGILAVVVYAI